MAARAIRKLRTAEGAAAGGGRGAARRARRLRPRRPDRLLQQPLSRDDDRAAARRALAIGTPLRGVAARGDRPRPGLPPGHGRGLPRAAPRPCATSRAASSAHRIADGRWMRVRENRMAGRQPGAADHRHHRGAPPRRRSCACWRWRSSRPATRWRSPAPTTASPTSTTPSRPPPATPRPRCSAASRRRSCRAASIRRSSSPRCAASCEAGQAWQGTIVNRHRDGHLIEQETNIAPLRDEVGRITHYVAVKRDVTEARAQARALAESEARYRAVVEAQTEFIVRIAPGRLLDLHERGRRALHRHDARGDARRAGCTTTT